MNCFIDTHSHLDFEEFQNDFDEIIKKSNEVGVNKIIVPGVTIQDTERVINLVDKFDELYATVGVHPSEAKTWDDNCYDYLKKIAQNPKVVAIGEVGLDYYWDKSFNEIQQDVLRKQIELAKELGKPIVIHDRDAHQDTFKILKETKANEVGVVLHCFSGSVEFMRECVKEGYFISLGGVVTFKNAIKAKEVAREIPLEKLMLETDAPYLTPVPHRGKTNYPYFIPIIATEIAELRGISIDELAKTTTQNANSFFKLI